MYCPPLRDMSKKFATEILAGRKFLIEQSNIKRVVNPPHFKEFSVKNIWASIKNMKNASEIIKYFPNYAKTLYPNKDFMINILNTLDPGLVI